MENFKKKRDIDNSLQELQLFSHKLMESSLAEESFTGESMFIRDGLMRGGCKVGPGMAPQEAGEGFKNFTKNK